MLYLCLTAGMLKRLSHVLLTNSALTIKIFFAKKPLLYTEMCSNIIRLKVFFNTFIDKKEVLFMKKKITQRESRERL